jgi:hypothetical protein
MGKKQMIVRTVIETIDPARAAAELKKSAGRNYRPLNEKWAALIASDIMAGRFVFNHKPIEFDANGILHDGQHRLRAVVKSGIACQFVVVYGSEPAESEGAVRSRTASDHLNARGTKNAVMVASAARTVIAWERGLIQGSQGAYMTTSEVAQYADDNPLLAEIVAPCKAINVKGLIASVVAAVCFIGCVRIKRPHDISEAMSFIEELKSGVGLESTSPTKALRERAIRCSTSKLEKQTKAASIALTIIAWNYYVNKKPCRLLRWKPSDNFPEIE